jgi:tetratricopeptide (TPR) repeat protein
MRGLPPRQETIMSKRIWKAMVIAAALVLVPAAWADGSDGGGGGGGDADDSATQPDYVKGVAAIKAQRYAEAIALLSRHVLARDGHADGHNWLAYAYRKSGRLDEAFRHYKRALGIDPQHLGAHEYLGEAYLMAKQPDEARKQLQRLAQLCASQCEEYRDLQRAIGEFTAKR